MVMRRWLLIFLPIFLSPVIGWADPVNINSADAATLARELKGIGPAKAEAIVAYRKDHGPFRSVEELALVKGIGPRFIEQNRDSIKLGVPSRAAAAPAAPNSRALAPAGPRPAR
jgi:competence protein ComEA